MANDRRRIDCHQHVLFDEYKSGLEVQGIHGSGERGWPEWSAAAMLDVMDANEIDGAVVSIASPGTYFGDLDATKRLVGRCNEAFARMVADNAGRIAALGLVSLPDAEAAAGDVGHILDTLKLDGVGLVCHYDDKYLGEPEFDEFYAELDRRKAVAFVHPVRPLRPARLGYHFPSGFVELVSATGRVVANLLATGTLERYPNIRWFIPHAGGIVPAILYRLKKFETLPKFKDKVPAGVRAYLERIHYDVAQSVDPVTLRALMDLVPPERILFGTDYPSAIDPARVVSDTVQGVTGFDGFDPATLRMIERENALRLFPRFAGR